MEVLIKSDLGQWKLVNYNYEYGTPLWKSDGDVESEYNRILLNHYPQHFVNQVLNTDNATARHWIRGPIKHEKSGNLYLKYVENPNTLGIMGLFSKTGRVGMDDAPALRSWLGRLRGALDNGKDVYVSLNKHSHPLFHRALQNGEFNIEHMGSFEHPWGTWHTVKVSAKR